MTKKLFSVNRDAGVSGLRSDFEEHIYFSDDKNGIIIFDDTLANVTAAVADYYVEKGYHVGFLTDTSDAAHAYACPNDSFRAWLRGEGVDNLQKMIDRTSILISSEEGFTGSLKDCGLHWFVSISRYLRIRNQNGMSGKIPPEIGNLKNALTHASSDLDFSNTNLEGAIPLPLYKLSNAKTIDLGSNNLTGVVSPDIKYMTNLEFFSVVNNELGGEFPSEIGLLSNITVLGLHSNNFTSLPVEIGQLSTLQRLPAYANNITSYEAGTISTNQSALWHVTLYGQKGTSTETGLPSADIDQIIFDVADNVLANNIEDGDLEVHQNFPHTAAVTTPLEKYGDMSALDYLHSKGWSINVEGDWTEPI